MKQNKIVNKFLDIFGLEVKNDVRNQVINAVFGDGSASQHQFLNSAKAFEYYAKASPAFNAIDLISQEFANICPVLYDKQKDEYVYSHALLDLLNAPNVMNTKRLFMEQVAGYFLITGNLPLVATALSEDREPLELWAVSPIQLAIMANTTDGFAGEYKVSNNNGTLLSYYRQDKGDRYRYYTKDRTKELWHIKKFNPNQGDCNLYGLSVMTPLYYELEQYIEASKHNTALLKNGARLSGMLLAAGAMSKEQKEYLREQINRSYTGSTNAGKIILAEAVSGIDFKEMGQSNKDLDFAVLKGQVEGAIYKGYKVPLPLVNADTMTLNNYTQALKVLYYNAVLPLAQRLFDEMGAFLLPRYKDGDKYELTFNKFDIPALEGDQIEMAKVKKDTGVVSANELRATMGYDPKEGADDIYIPMGQVPINEDQSLSTEQARQMAKELNNA